MGTHTDNRPMQPNYPISTGAENMPETVCDQVKTDFNEGQC